MVKIWVKYVYWEMIINPWTCLDCIPIMDYHRIHSIVYLLIYPFYICIYIIIHIYNIYPSSMHQPPHRQRCEVPHPRTECRWMGQVWLRGGRWTPLHHPVQMTMTLHSLTHGDDWGSPILRPPYGLQWEMRYTTKNRTFKGLWVCPNTGGIYGCENYD